MNHVTETACPIQTNGRDVTANLIPISTRQSQEERDREGVSSLVIQL